MIAAQPIVTRALGLLVGMLVILYPKVLVGLLNGISNTAVLFCIVLRHFILRHVVQVRAFPRRKLIRIVSLRNDLGTALQDQDLQATLGKLFGRHTTTHSRTHYDRVEIRHLSTSYRIATDVLVL